MLNSKQLANLPIPGLSAPRTQSELMLQAANIIHSIQILDARTQPVKTSPVKTGGGLSPIEERRTNSGDGEIQESEGGGGTTTEYSGPFAVTASGSITGGYAYCNGDAVTCSSGSVTPTANKYVCLQITMTLDSSYEATYSSSYTLETLPQAAPEDDLTTYTPSSTVVKYPIALFNSDATAVTQMSYGIPHVFIYGRVSNNS